MRIFTRERMWKLDSWLTGAAGAFVAELLLRTIYKLIRKDKPTAAVFDPNDRRFTWSDAAVWAVAGGLGLAAAKIASARLAVVGWRAATGTAPPGADGNDAG